LNGYIVLHHISAVVIVSRLLAALTNFVPFLVPLLYLGLGGKRGDFALFFFLCVTHDSAASPSVLPACALQDWPLFATTAVFFLFPDSFSPSAATPLL